MKFRIFFIFPFLFVTPFITQATHLGVSLDYDGDQLSGAVSCGYDLGHTRLESTLHIDDNLNMQPNFTALPIYSTQHSTDPKALSELETMLINWHAHAAIFTYSKYLKRKQEDQEEHRALVSKKAKKSAAITSDKLAGAKQNIRQKKNRQRAGEFYE